MTLADVDIKIESAGEILNMGGPWVGDLYVSGKFITSGCLLDNYVIKEKQQLLFFIKHNRINRYWYFSVNFLDLNSFTQYQFDEEFTMAYLGEFVGENQLEVYRAFHNQFPSSKIIFDLDAENFQQVS